MNKSKKDDTPVVVAKAYDFVLWLLPKVESFNRAYRFTVGERLTAQGLDLMTTLVEAAYSREKDDLLHAGQPIRECLHLRAARLTRAEVIRVEHITAPAPW